MPADADPRALRCSWLCTVRANSGVRPPAAGRRCLECGVEIADVADTRKVYCTVECRTSAFRRRRRR